MRLVADANELFSFFNKVSKAREISLLPKLDIHSPGFSLEEIKKHKSDIIERFSLTESQFSLIKKLLGSVVSSDKQEKYSDKLKEAKELSPDPKDVEYFALALKLNCSLWSEDKKLKEQSRVKVLSTTDLLKMLKS